MPSIVFINTFLVERFITTNMGFLFRKIWKPSFQYFKNKSSTEDLLESDLYEFLRFELSLGLSIATALGRLSSTRSFYLFLKKEGFYQGNIPEIETPKKPKLLPNCLSEDEVDLLLNALIFQLLVA